MTCIFNRKATFELHLAERIRYIKATGSDSSNFTREYMFENTPYVPQRPSRHSRANEFNKFLTEFWASPCSLDECFKLRRGATLDDLAESSCSTKGTPLKFSGTFNVLLDGIFRHRGTLHTRLEQRCDIIKAL